MPKSVPYDFQVLHESEASILGSSRLVKLTDSLTFHEAVIFNTLVLHWHRTNEPIVRQVLKRFTMCFSRILVSLNAAGLIERTKMGSYAAYKPSKKGLKIHREYLDSLHADIKLSAA